MGQRWSNGWRWPGLRRRWGVAGVVIAAAAGTLAPAAGRALPVADGARLPAGCRSFGPGRAVPALFDAAAGVTAGADVRRDRNQVAALQDAIRKQARSAFVLEA